MQLCAVLFDEMTLTRGLQLADHALVFIIVGIEKKYKQPIDYFPNDTVVTAGL